MMNQRETLKTSWVYSLRKDDLVSYLVQCAQDPTGTVDEMRRRLAKFVNTEHDEKLSEKLRTWQKQHEQSEVSSPGISLTAPVGKNDYDRALTAAESLPNMGTEPKLRENDENYTRDDRVATIEVVRKWGLKYDGGKEVLNFIDRLEELAGMYGINPSDVIPVMFELLRGKALVWFRSNHKPWADWQQFKADFLGFFLPPRYFEKLEDEIRRRTQRQRESFKDYLLSMQDLMYHSRLNAKEQLEVIFRNSLPDYQWYIRRRDFASLSDLLELAADLESIPPSTHTGRNEYHRMLRNQPSLSHARKPSTTGKGTQSTYLSWEGEKLQATILFNQRPSIAIVDTGATRSFVMPWFIRQIQPKLKYLDTKVEVTLADGSKKRISSAVKAPITFGSVNKTHEFLIMEEATEPIILGVDFLREFNTTIQCAGLRASWEAMSSVGKRNVDPTNQVRELMSVSCARSPNFVCAGDKKLLEQRISKFLEEELPKFKKIKGLSTAATHRIVMRDNRPIKIRYAPRNPAMQAIIDEEVNSLLERGCIEPSHSPYSFPITLVKKKNGTWRTCMDFRQLNARSVPDAYPLPRIHTILDRLRNAKFISSLDLKDGYWQIPMDAESKQYTAFAVTGRGLYQWRVMPFGLHSAPATFQRALDNVIGPDMEPYAFAYLDDIIVIGKTFDEHLANLREVFRRLRAANLKINTEKCEFFKSETRYLGHIITSEGIKTDPEKIAAIIQLPRPQDTKGVRRFLGITSWYRRFVPNFAKISQPLTQLLKKGKHWKWGPEQQAAFEELKDCLTKSPVLACPDFTKPFSLQTDASEGGLGAVLTQEIDGEEHVIAYASRHLNGAEKNYSATEKECLAIIWGIRKMRPYLEGYVFRVITDHLSLKWLNSIDNPTGRLARWALELQQYQFEISYRKGQQNVVADALSRQPIVEVNLVQVRPSATCPWYEGKLAAVRESPEHYSDYAIVDNLLYRHFEREINDEDSTPWKLCVPTSQRQQVLTETHDKATGGHLGIRKTLNKVASRYYWPGMARDVSRYVRQCESCQQYKTAQQQPAGKMLTRIQSEPWSLICADFIGPLPRTKHGNTMLLVLFDNFSKWVELIPLRKATGEGVVKALRERIISRYGVPKALITDNGPQFTSHTVKRYLKEVGVQQQFTAPYTPQENPTERVNRTVKTIIAQFSGKGHNRWDEWLPEIMLAINTSESESTGYTPAFLTQGRSPRLPNALYDEVTVGSGARCVGPEERASELKEIFQIVRRNLEKASQKQRRHYNLRRRSWRPEIGEQVLARQHPLSKAINNFAAKLAPKFKGPYVVTGFVSPVIVEIRDVETREKRTAHISELKSYHAINQLLSLTLPRSNKTKMPKRTTEKMEAAEQRFERTRKKFQQNIQREQEKRRRTIFLEDDEVPSTSRGGANKKKRTRPTKTQYQASPSQRTTKAGEDEAKQARHFRITTTTPQGRNSDKPVYLETTAIPAWADTVNCVHDEEIPPPPPPFVIINEEPVRHEPTIAPDWGDAVDRESEDEKAPPPPRIIPEEEFHGTVTSDDLECMSPIFEDESLMRGDFIIDPEDWEDSLILEFARTFYGANDTTVDVRPVRNPSPPSSFSSLDWEDENFRPPTPPRRRAFGTFDVQDREYQYLGMRCFERNWRARILVPGVKQMSALISAEEPTIHQDIDKELHLTPVTPLHGTRSPTPVRPTTPGRGWLHVLDTGGKVPTSNKENTTSPPRIAHPSPPPLHESPIPSPPPMTSKPVDETLSFDQLPLELQSIITKKKARYQGERTRFIRKIDGIRYRATILRDGTVRVTLAEREN